MSIEVVNELGIDVLEVELVSVVWFVIVKMDVNLCVELLMLLLDIVVMVDLYMCWMDFFGLIDVMSFLMDEFELGGCFDVFELGLFMLGDIVLCLEFVVEQVVVVGYSLGYELVLLIIYGVFYLFGYDYVELDEEKEMFVLQDWLFEEWVVDQVEVYQYDWQDEKDCWLFDKLRYFDF